MKNQTIQKALENEKNINKAIIADQEQLMNILYILEYKGINVEKIIAEFNENNYDNPNQYKKKIVKAEDDFDVSGSFHSSKFSDMTLSSFYLTEYNYKNIKKKKKNNENKNNNNNQNNNNNNNQNNNNNNEKKVEKIEIKKIITRNGSQKNNLNNDNKKSNTVNINNNNNININNNFNNNNAYNSNNVNNKRNENKNKNLDIKIYNSNTNRNSGKIKPENNNNKLLIQRMLKKTSRKNSAIGSQFTSGLKP